MPYFHFVWSPQIEEHLDDNRVSRDDFEYVVLNSSKLRRSRSSGHHRVTGIGPDGRRLCCIFEIHDDLYVIPVTAFQIGPR
jgi:hypothetical protein